MVVVEGAAPSAWAEMEPGWTHDNLLTPVDWASCLSVVLGFYIKIKVRIIRFAIETGLRIFIPVGYKVLCLEVGWPSKPIVSRLVEK